TTIRPTTKPRRSNSSWNKLNCSPLTESHSGTRIQSAACSLSSADVALTALMADGEGGGGSAARSRKSGLLRPYAVANPSMKGLCQGVGYTASSDRPDLSDKSVRRCFLVEPLTTMANASLVDLVVFD